MIDFKCSKEHLPPVCASNLLVAMASISSIKMIAGAFSLASLNTSLTIRGPSPKYFCTNSEPTTRMKEAATNNCDRSNVQNTNFLL